jgi:hypothetical protein
MNYINLRAIRIKTLAIAFMILGLLSVIPPKVTAEPCSGCGGGPFSCCVEVTITSGPGGDEVRVRVVGWYGAIYT